MYRPSRTLAVILALVVSLVGTLVATPAHADRSKNANTSNGNAPWKQDDSTTTSTTSTTSTSTTSTTSTTTTVPESEPEPEPVPEPVPSEVRVSFQPEGAVVPSGYVADVGEAFDSARGFGWVEADSDSPKSIVGRAFERGVSADQRLDTFTHMQESWTYDGTQWVSTFDPARFEHVLASGTYDVTVAVGDAEYFGGDHVVHAEGVTVVDHFQPSSSQPHLVATVRVDVTDGKLTLDATGGDNTKIDYVDAVPATGDAPAEEPTDGSGGSGGVAKARDGVFPRTSYGSYPKTYPGGYDFLVGEWEASSFLNRGVSSVREVIGKGTWSQWGNTASAILGNSDAYVQGVDRYTLDLVFPLFTGDDGFDSSVMRQNFKRVAAGEFDHHYQDFVDVAKANDWGVSRPNLILNTLHEFDGRAGGGPWRIDGGNADVAAAAVKHVNEFLKARLPNVRTSFGRMSMAMTNYYDASGNDTGLSPLEAIVAELEKLGPISDHFDVVYQDLYDKSSWSFLQSRLDEVHQVAVDHNLGFAVSEWGLWIETKGNGDNPQFITNMFNYLDALPATGAGRLVNHNYFEGHTEVSLFENFPNAKARYQELFGT